MPGKVAPAAKKAAKKKASSKTVAAKTKVAAAKKAPAKKAVPAKQSAPAKTGGGKIAVGKKVPAFSSLITGGSTWRSSAAAGKNLVIYFYPRDNTSGCTLEGQQFRDLTPEFNKVN